MTDNPISLANAGGSHRHASLPQYERSEADLYVTPPEPVQRLYRARPQLKDRLAWDASAGTGAIVRAIRDLGGRAVGTELHDHPFPKVADITTGVDLFKLQYPVSPCAIINPPYSHARQHIGHLLKLKCDVYALLRVPFIASKKTALMFPHFRELLLVGRPGMLPPGAVDKGGTPQIDFGWFCFTANPKQPGDNGIVLERI